MQEQGPFSDHGSGKKRQTGVNTVCNRQIHDKKSLTPLITDPKGEVSFSMFFLGSNQCFLTEPSVKFSLTALLENTDYNARKTRRKQDKHVLVELKCSFAVLAWFALGGGGA